MKWIVTGQVFLADGFDWEIEADTEEEARYLATARAHDLSWDEAEIQEVCINGSQKVEEDTAPRAPVTLSQVETVLNEMVAAGQIRCVDGKYFLVKTP